MGSAAGRSGGRRFAGDSQSEKGEHRLCDGRTGSVLSSRSQGIVRLSKVKYGKVR